MNNFNELSAQYTTHFCEIEMKIQKNGMSFDKNMKICWNFVVLIRTLIFFCSLSIAKCYYLCADFLDFSSFTVIYGVLKTPEISRVAMPETW
jgi:hypothetical protein